MREVVELKNGEVPFGQVVRVKSGMRDCEFDCSFGTDMGLIVIFSNCDSFDGRNSIPPQNGFKYNYRINRDGIKHDLILVDNWGPVILR